MAMTLKQLVEKRLAETGRNQFEAARAGGLDRLFLRDILIGKKQGVQGKNQAKLALALDMEVEDLIQMTTDPVPPSRAPALAGEVRPAAVPYPYRNQMPADVPIYGTAAASVVGTFEGFNFEDGEIGYARRPPGLMNHRDAYAIYVVNDSMYPEHRAGDLRFATPHRPPVVGDTVILQVRAFDGAPLQAFIKTLVKMTRDTIIVSQHNPPATMEFKRDTVLHIHRVPPLNDLYGV